MTEDSARNSAEPAPGSDDRTVPGPAAGAVDVREWLWKQADNSRARGHADPGALLAAAAEAGIEMTWRDVSFLAERFGRRGFLAPSEYVVDFMRHYLRGRHAALAWDPAVTAPSVLLALVDGDVAAKGVGAIRADPFAPDAARAFSNQDVEWQRVIGDEPPAPGEPDLIISVPPMAHRREQVSYTAPDGTKVTVNDDVGPQSMFAASAMSEDGEALFIVANPFVFRHGAATVRAVLPRFGLHVHACLSVGQPFREAGVACSLISIRKQPATSVWVGQLTPQTDPALLATAMRSRKQGRTVELGRLVEWDNYKSFDLLGAGEQLDRLVKRGGFPLVPLADVLIEPAQMPSKEQGVLVTPTPNTVYLPTFLSARTHSDADAADLKASGYVVLRLEPEKAMASYVSALFNSELGRALRASWSSGASIVNLRASALAAAEIPLPPIKGQREADATRREIRSMRVSLDVLEGQLLERPRDATKLRRQLRQLGQTDPLKAWMESLPFPLASIARRYQTDAEPKDKVDHLLRLFEASAEFFVTLLLSAFASDDALLAAERSKWVDQDGRLSLQRASFGNWTKLGAAMAGSARRLAAAKDDAALSSRLATALAVHSPTFIAMLTGKELWKLLDGLTDERNIDAHGGIKGAAERERKLARLEESLTELRALTTEPVQDVRLILPGEGALRKGVNQYRKAQDLSGYAETFPQRLLESSVQLEAEELYLIDVSDEPISSGLKLAPLVRFAAAPSTAENACYFYSRLEGACAEYVSHHFEKEARIPVDDPELLALLRRVSTE